MSKLDDILNSVIQGLQVLAPLTSTDLDDRILSFLLWLRGDTQARTVMMNASCEDCDLKNPQSFPIDAELQVTRWRESAGYTSALAADIDWIKTITKVIELWKLISLFLQKEGEEDKAAPLEEDSKD